MNYFKMIESTMDEIRPLDDVAVEAAWNRIDNLTKPLGSLGMLEEISAKIAGIKGFIPNSLNKKNIIIMCSDNGVTEEAVSTCPQITTAIVTNNFTKGITGVNALAKFSHTDITVVDIGINQDLNNTQIINRKISYGTKNITKAAAMTKNQAVLAMVTGIEIVDGLCKQGYDILGTGEMGVGNTTTSSAVFKALSGLPTDLVVGKGSGLDNKQYENKKRVVEKALEVNNITEEDDVIDIISKVGGYDIAALCGCFIGAAKNRIPIVIDGFISSVAALCAYKMNSLVRDFMFPSHLSAEPGAIYIMEELKLEPMLNLKMRLGEGSGCPLAFDIINGALYAVNNMGSFEDANLHKSNYVDIRK